MFFSSEVEGSPFAVTTVKHERCFIAEDVYFVRAKFQGRHCVVQVSSGDYSQDMSIIVKSNHIEKDRRHTHGAAGGTKQQLPHSQHQPLLGHIIDKFTGE